MSNAEWCTNLEYSFSCRRLSRFETKEIWNSLLLIQFTYKTKGNYVIKYKSVPLYYDNLHLTKAWAKTVSEVFDPVFYTSMTVLNKDTKKAKL